MTKAELIDEVSKVVEMTRKDSETIVETIFDSIVSSLHKAKRSKFGDLEASERGRDSLALAAIRRPAHGSRCHQNAFPISNQARNCEIWSITARGKIPNRPQSWSLLRRGAKASPYRNSRTSHGSPVDALACHVHEK